MLARVRFTLALLALFAFGSAGGARAWASASSEPATAAVTCMGEMTGECAHDSHDGNGPVSDCPSMPAGMMGSCSVFAVALPSTSWGDLSVIAPVRRSPVTSDDVPVLMLARGIFHPPRA